MDSANYENMMAQSNPLPGERLGFLHARGSYGALNPEKAAVGGFGAVLFLAGARHIYMNSNGDWQDYAAAMAMLLAGGLMTNSIY